MLNILRQNFAFGSLFKNAPILLCFLFASAFLLACNVTAKLGEVALFFKFRVVIPFSININARQLMKETRC